MTKKKSITAGELIAKLSSDPEFVAMSAGKEEERLREEAELRRAEQPLLQELRRVGLGLDSVWELVNTEAPYPEALPILVQHLPRDYPSPVRDGIARALAVPAARFAWPVVVRMYRQEPAGRVKDGLAVAISRMSDDEVVGEVIALARDVRLGPSRLLLLSALERSDDPRARATLMDLGTDPELKEEIQVILRRLKRRRR